MFVASSVLGDGAGWKSDLYGKVVRAAALRSSNLNWAINSNKTSDNSIWETFSEYFPNHFVRFNQLSQGAKSTSSNDYVFIKETPSACAAFTKQIFHTITHGWRGETRDFSANDFFGD